MEPFQEPSGPGRGKERRFLKVSAQEESGCAVGLMKGGGEVRPSAASMVSILGAGAESAEAGGRTEREIIQ